MNICKVKIIFRDEKEEDIDCCDTPSIEDMWITLYPFESVTKRRYIRSETVDSIEFDWSCKKEES